MIRVNEDYVIKVDECNYMPCLDMHATKLDKNGEEIPLYKTIGYYNTLEGAIKGLLDHKVKNVLSNNDMGLESALTEVKQIYSEFDNLIKKVVGRNDGHISDKNIEDDGK